MSGKHSGRLRSLSLSIALLTTQNKGSAWLFVDNTPFRIFRDGQRLDVIVHISQQRSELRGPRPFKAAVRSVSLRLFHGRWRRPHFFDPGRPSFHAESLGSRKFRPNGSFRHFYVARFNTRCRALTRTFTLCSRSRALQVPVPFMSVLSPQLTIKPLRAPDSCELFVGWLINEQSNAKQSKK